MRGRLVSVITDTATPVDKLPKLVNTLLNLEHLIHEIKLTSVKKEGKSVGFVK